jgi:ABC-2 type transport system ATP-binding protein
VEAPPAITTRDLTKHFGEVVALDGLDLDVPQGTVFGLLGPSGAGKTTTLRLLAGLARPTSGSVTVAGLPVNPGDGIEARRRTGVLDQDARFYGWMTGRELLAFVADLVGIGRGEMAARIDETLTQVGLTGAADRRIDGYTGELRRRVGIAQALVGRPEVLLLDDPISGLDPLARSEILALIRDLRASATVIVASSDPAHIELVCDRVAVLERGRLIIDARVDALVGGVTQTAYVVEIDPGPGLALAGLVERLRLERWVVGARAEQHVLRVTVRDEVRAAHELLTSIVATGLSIATFRRERPTLGDAVAELVDRARADEAQP